jgi:hypothetical protein
MTFDEYRQGIAYVMKTADQHELPLLIDVFLNTTICQIENRDFGGSLSTLEGPYFSSTTLRRARRRRAVRRGCRLSSADVPWCSLRSVPVGW